MKEFTFSIENSLPPKEIIEKEFLPIIKDVSHEYLFAELKEYSGEIRSYETIEKGFPGAVSALFPKEGERKYHDIQKELGELNKTYSTFELSIKSRIYENYKYRILFIRYGQAGYPATVVMAESIAREITMPVTLEKSYIYRIETMLEMKNLLVKVLDSESLYSVMQEAINISMIEEQRREIQRLEDKRAIEELIQ